jgi:dihydroorotase
VSRLLVRNGRVVDPARGFDAPADVVIENGVVAAVGAGLTADGDVDVLEAAGCVVAPGFIDAHTHLREPGFEQKETVESGCRAAAAGGFTAVCCLANTQPVNDQPAVVRYIMDRAARAGGARVYPIGAVSVGREGEALAEIGEMVEAGAIAVSDSPRPVTSSLLMRRALEYARSFDVPVVSHAEDPVLSDGGSVNEGRVSTRIGLRGMPAASEESMVARDLLLTRLTGGRLHLAHLSTAGSIALVERAREDGLSVTCAVTPHHLSLTDEDVAASNYDPNWKVNPPLRTAVDRDALVRAVADGTVDLIASDHAPHHQDEKDYDFAVAPFGVIGMETAVPVILDEIHHRHGVDLGRVIALFTSGPAGVFNLPGGSLAEGAPGDVTVIDPEREVTIDPKTFRSKSRNTPFAGRRCRGMAVATVVAGRVIWRIDD